MPNYGIFAKGKIFNQQDTQSSKRYPILMKKHKLKVSTLYSMAKYLQSWAHNYCFATVVCTVHTCCLLQEKLICGVPGETLATLQAKYNNPALPADKCQMAKILAK